MQCDDIKSRLEADREDRPLPKATADHLGQCAECREFAEDLKLQRLLGTMPLREPEEGFEARVLDAALSTQPDARSNTKIDRTDMAWMGLAASLVIAVLVGLQWQDSSSAVNSHELATTPVQMQVGELEPVEVMLNSGRDLQNVTVTVDLPTHLALKGYESSQRLQWTSDLNTGGNKLVLPVRFREDRVREMDDGETANTEIVIELEHEGLRKQFRVPVKPVFRSSEAAPLIYVS